MVNSEVSGVAFSRHPLTPLSSNTVLVEAVYGLGEGLVSGELEADRYEVHVYTLILVYVHAGGGRVGDTEAVYGLGEGLVSGELEANRYEVHLYITNKTE